jgi:GNAT superfamily N-acetyltransferase
MLKIRDYLPEDGQAVGRLIRDTYGAVNLSFLPEEMRGPYLGPFVHAYSPDPAHQQKIAELIQAPIVFVAELDGNIVGVLRGRVSRLHSLFVDQGHHRQGIGSLLLERFETECREFGAEKITLASTLIAVAFYQKLGFKKTTGVRRGWSFDGERFKWQPMKKVL